MYEDKKQPLALAQSILVDSQVVGSTIPFQWIPKTRNHSDKRGVPVTQQLTFPLTYKVSCYNLLQHELLQH